MFHSNIEIKEGAFFISDAHYSHLRPELLTFLQDIESRRVSIPQIFLMGDICDALFGGITKTYENNEAIIDVINRLSQKLEVIYLEGNHDFNIKTLFPQTKVFSIQQQPLTCTYKTKKVILAHGDFDGNLGYKVYTAFIRNRLILKFLNLFDTYILKKLDSYLSEKDDCLEFSWFPDFIKKRMQDNYDCDYFIEGHFHQNKSFQLGKMHYINLAAFACNQRYFIVKSSNNKELIEESIFSKER